MCDFGGDLRSEFVENVDFTLFSAVRAPEKVENFRNFRKFSKWSETMGNGRKWVWECILMRLTRVLRGETYSEPLSPHALTGGLGCGAPQERAKRGNLPQRRKK